MQTTGDRADFPAGTAVSGSSTADSSGNNGPFTVYDALMREREALVYHRQMLERKRTALEQSLQKQRSEKRKCPALFVFPLAEDLMIAAQSDRVQSTVSTHGIAHQCVHNSAVLSSWSTPIDSGVGATGLTKYQKSFHAQYLTRALRLFKEIHLCSANQVAVMRALSTVHPAPMLRRLELDVPEITEPMVQKLYQWETENQLEYIAIRICCVTSTLPLLSNLSLLRSLDLSNTTITNEDLRGLQGCHNLVKLDLSYCRGVTDLSPILHIQTLEVVKLYRCEQLVGVGSLGRLPCLKELELSETAVTDEDIFLLSESHTLVKIDLCWCKALTNVNPLSSIATLEVINLSYCFSLAHLGELGKLPVLKEVYLSCTRITDDDLRLVSECHTLVRINLFWCELLKNVNPLYSITTLEVISLSYCTCVTNLGALGKLPVLRDVDLSGTRMTDEDVRQLSECHTLVRIDLHCCKALTNVNPLSSIATLEVIDLSWSPSLTRVGALGKLPVLKEVDLSGTRITDEEVRQLSECHTLVKVHLNSCEALTNVNSLSSIMILEEIDLSWCTSLTHLCTLGRLTVLKEVDLGGTRITDEDVRLLSECHTLVKIDLHCCKTLTNVNPLSSISTLEVINLDGCTSLTRLGELGKLPVLREVNLSETRITLGEVYSLTSLRHRLGLPPIKIRR